MCISTLHARIQSPQWSHSDWLICLWKNMTHLPQLRTLRTPFASSMPMNTRRSSQIMALNDKQNSPPPPTPPPPHTHAYANRCRSIKSRVDVKRPYWVQFIKKFVESIYLTWLSAVGCNKSWNKCYCNKPSILKAFHWCFQWKQETESYFPWTKKSKLQKEWRPLRFQGSWRNNSALTPVSSTLELKMAC